MKPIELNILFNSDNTNALEDLEIPCKMTDCEVRKMTFYNITAISIFYDDRNGNKEYSMIHSNADEFICTDTYYVLKEKLKNHFSFNDFMN